MTMEALQADLTEIVKAAAALNPGLTTTGELVTFLKQNLVPFIESHVAESSEMDECIADIIDHAEDILQPESARIFGSVILGGLALAKKLEEVATASGTLDANIAKGIAEYKKLAAAAQQLLEEVAMPDDPDDEEDDEDGDIDEGIGSGPDDDTEEDDDEGDDEGGQP